MVIQTLGFIIPTLSLGGAERVVARLAEGLARDFRCILFLRRGGACHYPVANIAVFEIDYTATGIRRAVEEHNIDLILDHYHWDADHVRLMATLADEGLRIVLTEHNAWHYPLFQSARDRRPGYEYWFEERYAHYRKFAAVTLLNEETGTAFAVHLDNQRVIPNPVSYEPDGVSDPYSRTVINVSSFCKKSKRLDLLYAAWTDVLRQQPDARLCIVGEYNHVNDLYFRRTSGLGDVPVQIVGRSRLVSMHYNRAALFALSSVIEGQPMVLLEAALHAMPAVAFDLPGLRSQVIDGETGLLVPFGDTHALGDAIASLLGDPARMRDMGHAARDMVLRAFSLERVLDTWRALIADIARDGRIHSANEPPDAAFTARNESFTRHWREAIAGQHYPSTPKVSFLVPVHGTEEVLPRCLRSLQEQVLKEFECIVVDDASPGDVAGIVRATVGDDARFRVIPHDSNRGLYQARSTAADAATGLYFANIDSDDYVHPLFAKILFREAITTGSDIVECRAVELSEEGRPIRFNGAMHAQPTDGAQASQAYFNGSLRNVLWNKLYSRELWFTSRDHNDIDVGLTVTEDTLRNTFLFPRARRYSAVEDCLYFYCRRSNSVVKGGNLERLRAKLDDISASYTRSRTHARDVLADRHALLKLEARRCNDIAWYVNEFLARNDADSLFADLLSDGRDHDDFLLLAHLAGSLATARQDAAHNRAAWQFERDHASQLHKKLQSIQDLSAVELPEEARPIQFTGSPRNVVWNKLLAPLAVCLAAARQKVARNRTAWQSRRDRANHLYQKIKSIHDLTKS